MKKGPYLSSLLLIAAVLFFANIFTARHAPDTAALERPQIAFTPFSADTDEEGWAMVGAWRLKSADPRVAGLSGLETLDGALVAISDSGRRLTFNAPEPSGGVQPIGIENLQSMSGASLAMHDTEAIAITQRETWVSFEMRHRLLRYDEDATAATANIKIHANWPQNRGAEALVAPWGEDGLLVLAEDGRKGLQLRDGKLRPLTVENATGSITGATRLADGRIVVLTRKIGLLGFRGYLAAAVLDGDTLRLGPATRLPTGPLTNPEGLASAPTNAGDRFYIVTDNNGLRWLQQALYVIDVEPGAWPPMP